MKPARFTLSFAFCKPFRQAQATQQRKAGAQPALHCSNDSDKEGRYPGKNDQKKRGPDPAINGTNRNVIARSAMTLRENGEEPTYPKVVSHNPKASLNPQTNRPVDKKVVYKLEESQPKRPRMH